MLQKNMLMPGGGRQHTFETIARTKALTRDLFALVEALSGETSIVSEIEDINLELEALHIQYRFSEEFHKEYCESRRAFHIYEQKLKIIESAEVSSLVCRRAAISNNSKLF